VTDAIATWLTQHLPPASGPALLWTAEHWDLVQPIGLALSVGVLAAELAVFSWWASA